VGTGFALTAGAAQSYAIYTLLVNPGALPGGYPALWLASPAFDSLFFLWLFLLLALFPTGRPLTPRWRFAVWLIAIGSLLGLAQAFQPYSIDPPLDSFQNPYIAHDGARLLDWSGMLSTPILLAGLLATIASVALRYRRSHGVERQQLKWFYVAVLMLVLLAILAIVIYATTGADISNGLFPIGVVLFPAATAVAMLRYRLYEVDVLIRKTLVYACLLAGLAAMYLAGVALLGALFRSVTGQSGTLAVTGSTLLVAAGFQPLRSRIQRAVDHRFYRARYDAARTLDAFSGRLRRQIDLDAIADDLAETAARTMQPRTVTVWLRSTGDA
ncbi:MAG: hypothetical protein QOI17_207, partial [Gaiellales bacterium]|nr:hypothetical protein [Gaiellales bacterium]